MSLLPKATFSIVFPSGLEAGRRNDGTLDLHLPEAVTGARALEVTFVTLLHRPHGKSIETVHLFEHDAEFPIAEAALDAGSRRFPLSLDLPASLPSALAVPPFAVEHRIELRLRGAFLVDPRERFSVSVLPAPRNVAREPLFVRSPPDFHRELSVELTLASRVVRQGEPVRGHVALRSGADVPLDSLELALNDVFVLDTSHRERVERVRALVSGPALRVGKQVAFELPTHELTPSWRSELFAHEIALVVTANVPWAFDPEFEAPIELVTRGSRLVGDEEVVPIGDERLRALAAEVAAATGLVAGSLPVLVRGREGVVDFTVEDAPRSVELGLTMRFAYPSLGLGLKWQRMPLLGGRSSPQIPEALRERYLLERAPGSRAPSFEDQALRPFVTQLLDGLVEDDHVELSDDALVVGLRSRADDVAEVSAVADAARTRARRLAIAIAELPMPQGTEHARAAWREFAEEQSARFVSSCPAIYGLTFVERVHTGEEQTFEVTIRTVWIDGAAQMRTTFDDEILVTEHFVDDPRALLPDIEAAIARALEARGKRAVRVPYR